MEDSPIISYQTNAYQLIVHLDTFTIVLTLHIFKENKKFKLILENTKLPIKVAENLGDVESIF